MNLRASRNIRYDVFPFCEIFINKSFLDKDKDENKINHCR